MSILIKGIEMPTSCFECKLLDYTDTFKCRFRFESLAREHGINISRPSWCPLVPVPPHGRLGDLDKLEKGLRHMAKYQHGERQQGILGCCETIRLAHTIIEAEEGE